MVRRTLNKHFPFCLCICADFVCCDENATIGDYVNTETVQTNTTSGENAVEAATVEDATVYDATVHAAFVSGCAESIGVFNASVVD